VRKHRTLNIERSTSNPELRHLDVGRSMLDARCCEPDFNASTNHESDY
jgi:hypothetical protein